jgi:HEAT repeat protein
VSLLRDEPDGSVRLELVKGLARLAYPTFLIGEEGFGQLLSLRARSREVILRVRNCLLSLLRDDESPAVRREAASCIGKLFAALFDKGDTMSNEEMRRTLLTQKRAYYFYPYFPGRIGYFYRRTFRYIPSRASYLLKPVREVMLEAYSSDPDAEVRKESILGLSLLERDPDVQFASVQGLGELGGASAAEALLLVYRKASNSAEIRQAAIFSIGRIGDRALLWRLAGFLATESNRDLKLTILEALGYHSDEQTAAVLTQVFRDKDADVRAAAATAAGKNFTDESLSPLKRLLQTDFNEKVRAAACTSLSKALGKEAADLLIGALRDSAPAVRKAAVVELGIRKIEESAESLASVLLDDPDPSVRAEAATSLGTIGGARTIQPLISAVARDTDGLVREQALQALLRTDEPRTAIVSILSELPRLAADNPRAYDELNDALPHLQQEARGRTIGQK